MTLAKDEIGFTIFWLLIQAFEMIKNALNDSWVSPAHRFSLSQRAVRMCQSPRFKQKLEPLLSGLPLLIAAEPRCVVITGRSLPRFVTICCFYY